jgi:diaminopimelate epimerase
MTPFLKMHGLGNDFVVFDARNQRLALSGSAARAIADRRFGVGCDQVIVIENAANGADAFMRIYNANGGEVESCGNAARCVARLLMDEKHSRAITLDTEGGLLACEAARSDHITIDMGVPRLSWREIPLARPVDTKSFALEVPSFSDPMLDRVAAVNVGNPHCVLFVDDADEAPVATLGPMIEIHPMFPRATNVEFVSKLDADRLRMRVWERGTGITMACGTGGCASAVAAMRRGLCGPKIAMVLDGGELTLEWHGEGTPVLMTGPGTLSFKGEIDLAELPS